MGFSAEQVFMDSSHWLQDSMQEENGMDSSSPSGEMLTCSGPVMERRLRPHHDQPLNCPRCDSIHTKFCYYNNYSLSQPRYFCKTCRRYWTKGGTLRNIPVGGGCRKNKKVSSKRPSGNDPINDQNYHGSSSYNPVDLHSSYPEHQFQFSHFNNLLGDPSFLEKKLINGDNAYRNFDFTGNAEMGMLGGVGVVDLSVQAQNLHQNFHGFCSPNGISIDRNISSGGANFMEAYQRLMVPYHDHEANDDLNGGDDVKPNARILAVDWQELDSSDSGKETFSYINGFGSSWNTMVNGFANGPSLKNPLV